MHCFAILGWSSLKKQCMDCPNLPLTNQIPARRIYVNGVPLHMKGVNWNPIAEGGFHPHGLGLERAEHSQTCCRNTWWWYDMKWICMFLFCRFSSKSIQGQQPRRIRCFWSLRQCILLKTKRGHWGLAYDWATEDIPEACHILYSLSIYI